jgi:hypothetical protein
MPTEQNEQPTPVAPTDPPILVLFNCLMLCVVATTLLLMLFTIVYSRLSN